MKPETHEFLRFPVGHFKDPKYDNGRCWQVTPHKTYCGQAPEYRCHVTTERTVNTDERLKKLRYWRMVHVSSNSDPYVDLSRAFSEIDFLLSLLDDQAEAFDRGYLGGSFQGHADGYELGYHDAATRMRDKCVGVAEDYRQRIEYEDDEGVREAMFGDMVMKMESLAGDYQ